MIHLSPPFKHSTFNKFIFLNIIHLRKQIFFVVWNSCPHFIESVLKSAASLLAYRTVTLQLLTKLVFSFSFSRNSTKGETSWRKTPIWKELLHKLSPFRQNYFSMMSLRILTATLFVAAVTNLFVSCTPQSGNLLGPDAGNWTVGECILAQVRLSGSHWFVWSSRTSPEVDNLFGHNYFLSNLSFAFIFS